MFEVFVQVGVRGFAIGALTEGLWQKSVSSASRSPLVLVGAR